jgi:phage terminase large subunit-like protein
MKSISPVHFIDKLVKKNTVEEDLRELNEQNDVVEIFADPYQMHRSITTLQAAGVPIKEYAQTQANCTLMGQTLFDLLTGLNLEVYPADELRQQALSTVAVENPRGWRIAKEKASKKIDAIVALAMACVAAMAHRGEIGSRSARGFNRAMQVSRGNRPNPCRDAGNHRCPAVQSWIDSRSGGIRERRHGPSASR